jgi:hypothetical protein
MPRTRALKDILARVSALHREELELKHKPRTSPLPVDHVYTTISNEKCEPGCGGCAQLSTMARELAALSVQASEIQKQIVWSELTKERTGRRPKVTAAQIATVASIKAVAAAKQLGVSESTIRNRRKK